MGGGRKDWKVSAIRTHDVKFPESEQKCYIENKVTCSGGKGGGPMGRSRPVSSRPA